MLTCFTCFKNEFENNTIFATANEVVVFKVNYLTVVFCFLGLSIVAQDVNTEDSTKISSQKTVSLDSLQPVVKENSKEVDQIISFAKTFLGTPYRWAGMTPSGFDCSGFISYVFGNFGFSLVHSSYAMAELGETVRLAEIQPGDLLFFKGTSTSSSRVGHVAMVIEVKPGAIMFIHSSTSRGVVIDNFVTSKHYISRFVKAKRLDYGVKK